MSDVGDKLEDVAGEARDAVSDAADHPLVEKAARVGYAANAVMHLLIGAIAVGLAMGKGGNADQGGALSILTAHTWGKALLVLGVLGWAALGLWQLGEGCLDYRDAKYRLKSCAKAATYIVLAVMCVSALTKGSGSSSHQNQSKSVGLMQHGWGVALIVIAGLVIIGVGVYHVVKGVKKKFLEDLVSHPGQGTEYAGQIGYTLKGLALILTGVFFVNGGLTHDSKDTGGLDTAVKSLLDKPLGTVMVLAIGLGFVAFAFYSAMRAKYAKV